MNINGNIRIQARVLGHPVVGALKRIEDDVFYELTHGGTVEIRNRQYADEDGTVYVVNRLGNLVCICGDDWCI